MVGLSGTWADGPEQWIERARMRSRVASTGLTWETCPVRAWLSCPVRPPQGRGRRGTRPWSPMSLPASAHLQGPILCLISATHSVVPGGLLATGLCTQCLPFASPARFPGCQARLWLLLATGPGSHALQCRDDGSAPGVTQPSLSRLHQEALRLCLDTGSLPLNPPQCPSLLALGEDGLMFGETKPSDGSSSSCRCPGPNPPDSAHLVLPHLPFRNI